MATSSIDRKGRLGEMGILELNGGGYAVPSFGAEKVYDVHPDIPSCSCPHHEKKKAFCKHLYLAEAVRDARALRFGARIAEANLTDFCHRIFAPLNGESRIVASDLFWEVWTYKHSTPRMKLAAYRRYKRAELLEESAA